MSRGVPWDSIDLHLIRVLHTVLTERSVTRAAVRLGMHQPAVSAALRRLRRLTGDALLVRGGAGLVPTAVAQRMLAPAAEILRQADTMLAAARAFDPARSEHTFTVAASDYLDPWFLPRLVARVKAEAPHCRVELQPLGGAPDYRQRLATGEVDVVIGNWPEVPGELHQGRLFGDEVVCLVARHHPALRRGWTLQDWLDAEHVAPTPPVPGALGVIDEHLARRGLRRNIVVRCPHFGLIPAMVADSLLVLTTGRQYCERFLPQLPLAMLPPPLEFPRLKYYQLWHDRTHHAPAAQWLRERIRDVAAGLAASKAGTATTATLPSAPSPQTGCLRPRRARPPEPHDEPSDSPTRAA
ncbi:HTH-type transcriptional regulator SyrM 1 [Tepidimonas sediminis]|uniref:HTH-type transcriptional regulator SyrM 1 n=1 Tax=Tepidimonas sediminis TaxID=2588941 RepID=A0A554WR93_9BURK|nr:LysR family transcriptional regulator [Tepidimonas sediminis]TSE26100.1 HTH-type transcriptional regulator SyrM 1 [Tepidimonas sediminis]